MESYCSQTEREEGERKEDGIWRQHGEKMGRKTESHLEQKDRKRQKTEPDERGGV